MIKTTVHIPIRDNEGKEFTREVWEGFAVSLLERFGGYSCDDHVRGAWRSPQGVTFWDVSRRYTIALRTWRLVPSFLEMVDAAIAQFRQEAVYVEIAGIPEIFALAPDRPGNS